ncbi:MAG: DUF3800 domain-containing protein [bacterium]|nr:DUF3800 domain-containing protein [bacterium]
MLIFIDESGDTGRKITTGSSRYFVISVVLFTENEEALSCDKRIGLIRHELGKKEDFEFHFANNSHAVRLAFLQAIQPYHFIYFAVIIDKDPKKLWGPGFETKESFYKYACQMVITNAMPYFDTATVILDQTGSPVFRRSLSKYLRAKVYQNNGKSIKKLKQQRSSSNNLIQLADYVAGVINRKAQDKKDWKEYYKYIADKENWVQTWPK